MRTDVTIQPGADGFLSMSVYAINLPGDVLYRTYASQRGWSNWAMNGGHSDWDAEPVEAVQIRLNGVFGNTYDVYYTTTLNDGTQCGWSTKGGTNGAMAVGKYITGFRYSLWGKNDPNAPYDMENPLVAAARRRNYHCGRNARIQQRHRRQLHRLGVERRRPLLCGGQHPGERLAVY